MKNKFSFSRVIDSFKKNNISKKQTVFIISSAIFIAIFGIAGVYFTVRYFTKAQTCFTAQQVASDSRCLYILSGKVYEKGTRSAPHHGNPCGSDVTAIIPSFHTADVARYLDPNYKGDICSNNVPAATNTPVPAATETPVPVATNTPAPTSTLVPTSATSNTDPTNTPTPIPTITTAFATITPTPSSILSGTAIPTVPTTTITTLPRTSGAPTWLIMGVPVMFVLAGLVGIIL